MDQKESNENKGEDASEGELVTDLYKANPGFPYTCFPYSKRDKVITPFRLYTEVYKDPTNPNGYQRGCIRELRGDEIKQLLADIKKRAAAQASWI